MSRWQSGLALSICLLFLAAASASAAIRPHAFYLSPQAGGYFFHEDQQIKDSPYYGLGLGYRFSRHWSGELVGSFIDSEFEEVDDTLETYLGRLEISYNFMPEGRFVPYIVIGFGGILYDDDDGPSDLDAVGEYGIGFQYFLSESVALRVDGRHIFTAENEDLDGKDFQHLSASGGLLFQFGGESTGSQVVDTDGDGIIDAFDRCPGTQLGVPVDGFGCPTDADQDGIPDYLDQCPSTPPGVSADSRGCPRDADQDGVPDQLDRCPGTRDGRDVDQDGCPKVPAMVPVAPVEPVAPVAPVVPTPPAAPTVAEPPSVESGAWQSFEMNLEFAPGTAGLRPEFNQKLQEAVRFIKGRKAGRMIVEGHTDSVGPADFNLALSQKRAETVRDYLVEQTGIPAGRIEAKGFGESQPVADNATQSGRAANRRVVIRVAE